MDILEVEGMEGVSDLEFEVFGVYVGGCGDVGDQLVFGGGECPEVESVDGLDAGDGGHGLLDFPWVEVPGGGVQEEAEAFLEEVP